MATATRSLTPHGPQAGLLPRRFQPELTLGYQFDLIELAGRIEGQPLDAALVGLRTTIGTIVGRLEGLRAAGVQPIEVRPTVAYLAALRLLRDLLQQGWTLRRQDDGLMLDPPLFAVGGSDDPATSKEAVRGSFSFVRNAQLGSSSVRRFVQMMERRGVGQLFADGSELTKRLTDAAARGELDRAVVPELELVDGERRDEFTGLRLMDVWRYARLFWSIPYQGTPGRNLFYLVRDAAIETRPIMGIAALGNAILGLAARDDALGWTVRGLRDELPDLDPLARERLLDHFESVLAAAIDGIWTADLPAAIGDPNDVDVVAAALRAVEARATASRRRELKLASAERTEEYALIRSAQTAAERGEPVDWRVIAETQLYRRKRAGALADLIEARAILARARSEHGQGALDELIDDERGRHAVDVVLRRIKQRAIAENVMELTTCGAVPPYGPLLGGKLTAMLMASPRVVSDFARRYEGRVSLIASGLAGRPVVRRPNLVLLTTSSLYSVGSSQYNRVRIEADGAKENGAVVYERIGVTESFGTVHFAPDTAAALHEMARLADDNRRVVSNLFGEGMSPKLRSLRAGIEALNLDSNVFLRHHSPRLLYAASLAWNTRAVLRGTDDTIDYILADTDSGGVDEIASLWRSRWLRKRIARPDVLAQVAESVRDGFLLGAHLPSESSEAPPATSSAIPASRLDASSSSEFLERLYRNTNSYADRLTHEELTWVNVDLGLGETLVGLAEDRRQIVITGNPGDGKTHLIESLRERLEATGALVLTDANALSDAELLDAWESCEDQGRPMVLAINEWPLFALGQDERGRDFVPLREALRQVQRGTYFLDAPDPRKGRVHVIDLSLRNVLAPEIVLAVIDRLTDERFFAGLHLDDPALANRQALQHSIVRERLVRLLAIVARRGHHATMRQLVGFVAYLLTGGAPASERLQHQGTQRFHYAQLAWHPQAEGPLFDAIRSTLDPACVTHPRHDLALWRGESRDGWILGAGPPGVQELSGATRLEAFQAVKRRFFFEHALGVELLSMLPSDEDAFERTVAEGLQSAAPVVAQMVVALNRFFEPDSIDRERLVLWQSHRFDVRPPETLIAQHEVDRHQLRVAPPRLAPWVEEWLPEDQRLTRAFALVAHVPGERETALLVDRSLYLTLLEAQRGLGKAGWSRSATRRITRFIDRLHHRFTESEAIAALRLRNVDTDLEQSIDVQRDPARYSL